jgi:hypothetical protein
LTEFPRPTWANPQPWWGKREPRGKAVAKSHSSARRARESQETKTQRRGQESAQRDSYGDGVCVEARSHRAGRVVVVVRKRSCTGNTRGVVMVLVVPMGDEQHHANIRIMRQLSSAGIVQCGDSWKASQRCSCYPDAKPIIAPLGLGVCTARETGLVCHGHFT